MRFLAFAVVLFIVASCLEFGEAQIEANCSAAPIACPTDPCGSILDTEAYCVYSCNQKCHLSLTNKDLANFILCRPYIVRDFAFQPADALACSGTGWLSNCDGAAVDILLSALEDIAANCV